MEGRGKQVSENARGTGAVKIRGGKNSCFDHLKGRKCFGRMAQNVPVGEDLLEENEFAPELRGISKK